MSAPEYARLVQRQARLTRYQAQNAPPNIIEWAERLVFESEALAEAERIVLTATDRGLRDA